MNAQSIAVTVGILGFLYSLGFTHRLWWGRSVVCAAFVACSALLGEYGWIVGVVAMFGLSIPFMKMEEDAATEA